MSYKDCKDKINDILMRNKSKIRAVQKDVKKILKKTQKYELHSVPDKKISRIIEKIQRVNISLSALLKKKWSDQTFFLKIGDIIRFSIIIKDEHNFCSTILEIIDILKSNKIKLNKCKSFIPVGDGFTGVNIICLKMFNNISIPFEIQFHTTKTIKLKYQPVTIKKKYDNLIYYLDENFDVLLKNNLNPESHKFIKFIADNLSNGTYSFNQHKMYRLYQIIYFIMSNSNISKDYKYKLIELETDLMNQMIKYEKKTVTKYLTECYTNQKLNKYCVNTIKSFNEKDFR
jgi:hypothetical protein